MTTPPPAPFRNGEAPREWFHVLDHGRYTDYVAPGEDAEWAQLLTPAMLDFHDRLVKRAFARTNRKLQLSQGCSAYRPIGDQRRAKRLYGRGAAGIGESSHGLWFEGRYMAAHDYGNWGSVYGWNRTLFYTDVRLEGGIPGYFDPNLRPGTPDEPWHVLVPDCFRLGVASAPSGGNAVPFDPEKPSIKESAKVTVYAVDKGSGEVFAIPEGGPAYIYPSITEYRAARALAIFVNTQNASIGNPLITVPPSEEDLNVKFKMDRAQIHRLMQMQGSR